MEKRHVETICVTSNEAWGEVWYSKQHYANELTKLGFNVYFIDPPSSWSPLNFLRLKIKKSSIKPNLNLIQIQNVFPQRIVPGFFQFLNDVINCWRLRTAIKEDAIFWQFDPFRFVRIFFFKGKRIYHVVDPYQDILTDSLLAEKADIIVLVDRFYQKFYPKEKSLVISHGVSDQEFVIEENLLNKYENEVGRDFVVFVGTFNSDVDYELLQKLTDRLKNRKMVCIGPLKHLNQNDLKKFHLFINSANVNWLGPQSAEKLKYYINLASVGIIPYKRRMNENSHRTPLKLMSYLAQGLAVVSTLKVDFPKDLESRVQFGASHIEFLKHVEEPKGKIELRRAKVMLDQLSYPRLINSILTRLYEKG